MNQRKIKFYVNKDFIVPSLSFTPLLLPFYRKTENKDTMSRILKPQEYAFNSRYFELTDSVKNTDYVLIPHDYWQLKNSHPNILQKIIKEAHYWRKSLVVDASGDVFGVIDIPHSVVLRTNRYRFSSSSREVTVPWPCEDLLNSYCNGKLILREKTNIPTLGFVGWGKLALHQRVRTLTKEFPHRLLSLIIPRYKTYQKGVFWRERVIEIFQNSQIIKNNFIIRSAYLGQVAVRTSNPKQTRKEFIDNILNSDYSLAIKGDSNSSVRFYETLSLGRIPVVIDTECMFPLEDKINYKEFCIFINYADIDRAPEILAQLHKNISPEQFVAMQEKARYIFRNYLRYDTFSRYLAEILRNRLSENQNL